MSMCIKLAAKQAVAEVHAEGDGDVIILQNTFLIDSDSDSDSASGIHEIIDLSGNASNKQK